MTGEHVLLSVTFYSSLDDAGSAGLDQLINDVLNISDLETDRIEDLVITERNAGK